MFWLIFIVCFVIGIVVFFCGLMELDFGNDGWRAIVVGSILCVPLILGFTAFSPDSEESLYTEYEIYALQDNIMVNGGGGLFYHYIDSELNYHVRRDYKDGKKVVELDGKKVYLVEASDTPKVQIIKKKRLTHLWLWAEWGTTVDIKIYVPVGTMENQFNSDME